MQECHLFGVPAVDDRVLLQQFCLKSEVCEVRSSPILPFYPPAIPGTFPSVYQLLPRTRHKSIVWEQDVEKPVDFYDPLLWDEMNWGFLASKQQPVDKVLMSESIDAAQRRVQSLHFLKLALSRA